MIFCIKDIIDTYVPSKYVEGIFYKEIRVVIFYFIIFI